jgi:hypothetical protein
MSDTTIATAIQEYLAEKQDKELGQFVDDRFFQLDEGNPELSRIVRHFIAVADQESPDNADIIGQFLLAVVSVIFNAELLTSRESLLE